MLVYKLNSALYCRCHRQRPLDGAASFWTESKFAHRLQTLKTIIADFSPYDLNLHHRLLKNTLCMS